MERPPSAIRLAGTAKRAASAEGGGADRFDAHGRGIRPALAGRLSRELDPLDRDTERRDGIVDGHETRVGAPALAPGVNTRPAGAGSRSSDHHARRRRRTGSPPGGPNARVGVCRRRRRGSRVSRRPSAPSVPSGRSRHAHEHVRAAGRDLVAKVGPGTRDEAEGLRLLRSIPDAPPVPEVVLGDDEFLVTGGRGAGPTHRRARRCTRTVAGRAARRPVSVLGRGLVVDRRFPRRSRHRSRRHTLLRAPAARTGRPLWSGRGRGPRGRPSRRPAAARRPQALLHGDLWWGNVLPGADGRSWLIDPSVHGGHPEEDLAMLALFGSGARALSRGVSRGTAART